MICIINIVDINPRCAFWLLDMVMNWTRNECESDKKFMHFRKIHFCSPCSIYIIMIKYSYLKLLSFLFCFDRKRRKEFLHLYPFLEFDELYTRIDRTKLCYTILYTQYIRYIYKRIEGKWQIIFLNGKTTKIYILK